MYTNFESMKSEIDTYISQGVSRLNAEWMWMETQGAGRLEKRMEGNVEVEKFVITNGNSFLKATETLKNYFKWRYGQQCRLEDLAKTNETL